MRIQIFQPSSKPKRSMQSFNDLPTASLAVYQQECCSAAQTFGAQRTIRLSHTVCACNLGGAYPQEINYVIKLVIGVTRRHTPKVPCEVYNAVDVTANRAGSVVPTLEFIQHHLTESSHVDLFVAIQATRLIGGPRSKRTPRSGLVHTLLVSTDFQCGTFHLAE
jgi:hypothetical protein